MLQKYNFLPFEGKLINGKKDNTYSFEKNKVLIYILFLLRYKTAIVSVSFNQATSLPIDCYLN